MKNRFIVVYTVFAAAVFIFSLSFFGYSLYNEYTTNKKSSTEDFNQLITDVRTISNKYTENTSSFSEEIKKSIKKPERYAFIEIKRDGQTILQYPAGKTKQATASNMTRSFELSLKIENNILVVNCNRYLIQPDSIFYYARISFLMILIITLITIIMIIYLNLTDGKTSIAEETETDSEDELSLDDDISFEATDDAEISDEAESEADGDIADSEEKNNETEKADETEAETDNAAADKAESVSDKKDVSQDNSTSKYGDFNAPEPEPIEPVELPIDEVKPASPSPEASAENPSGLYNPKTEIGWESYLLPRLNNEIDRATASEIDLALFEFKLPELNKDNEEFTNVCRYLTLQFQFKDLLFEYKEDSIIAIKISMNIDSAINFADKLYGDIRNIINSKACYIGISSRSIRIVTAERLMLEADQAVIHAIEDKDSPVVAFRVDSDKYRQMMESPSAEPAHS